MLRIFAMQYEWPKNSPLVSTVLKDKKGYQGILGTDLNKKGNVNRAALS